MLAVLLVMQAVGGTAPVTVQPVVSAQATAPPAAPAQVPGPSAPADPSAPYPSWQAPPEPTAAPEPLPSMAPAPGPAPAPYAPYPYYYPYPYPPQPYPPPQREAPPPPTPALEPEQDVTWFVRLELGLGPPGFSKQTELLQIEGYGGMKLWLTLDGGYLVHPNFGIGAWVGMSRWGSSPHERAPGLEERAYFIGGELPIKLGSRAIALVLAPRLGFCSGELSLGGEVPSQSALAFGAELSVTSFKYHLGGSLGLLRAAVGPPGELGRDHDLGGLYVLLGGTIDG